MTELLLELHYLINAGRLPHGDCGSFIGKPCNCYQAKVLRLFARQQVSGDKPQGERAVQS